MPPPPPQTPPPDALLSAIVDSSDDAIISKTLDGIITSWNRSAEQLFGYREDEAVGRPITLLLPEDRLKEEEEILRKVRRGERVDHFETVRRRKDGRLIDVSVTISPVRDASGTVVGVSKIARDIGSKKMWEQAGLLLAAIVSSSEDAIISKNLNSTITSWNAAAERIFGYTAQEAIGRSVLMLVPEGRKDEEPRILARLQRGERLEHFETIRVRKNGEHFPISLTISPVRDEQGTIVGASKIARDITAFRRLNAERDELLASERAARAQAEHASRMKDDFLATISHELRTPLNAIVGWTQVLKEDPESTAGVRDGLETIERNALAQAQLIDDLLDLTRIVSGKLTLDLERFDLTVVISDAIASLRLMAEAQAIRLKAVLGARAGTVMGDKKRMQQIVWNLLSNAIKFTPKNGLIVVTLARVNSHVEITINDSGKGIAPSFLPHVFERFRQADSSTTRHEGGLGIGLAIVKQLVELHGGEVRAESPGLGKGATFTVLLPVVVSRFDRVEDPEKAQLVAEIPRTDTRKLTGIKVLAIDDDPDSLALIHRVLSDREAIVQTASSVEEAKKLLAEFEPHLILSDIGMPGQDGYDLIRFIRALPQGKAVPAAALTALARPDDRMRALDAGFQTHVAKPVTPAELVAVVRSLASISMSRQ